MAKNPKLFKVMFYVDDYRASSRVNELTIGERGLLLELILASFMDESCSLPIKEKKLAQLARVDYAEFRIHWPQVQKFFKEKNGRLYNEKMVEAKKESQEAYQRSVNNGKKNKGKKKHEPSDAGERREDDDPQDDPQDNPQDDPQDNPSVKQPEPEPDIDPKIETPEERPPIPEAIGDILAGGFIPKKMDIITRTKRILSSDDWSRSGPWFEYMVNELNPVADLNEVVAHVENCLNPETRRAKDLSVLKNSGGYLRSKFIEIAKQNGINVPSDMQARNNCERTN